MKHALSGLIFALMVVPQWAVAATEAELARLAAAIGTDDVIEILREEGMAQADDLRVDMFPTRSPAAWQKETDAIYAYDAMHARFHEHFNQELADADVTALLTYLESAAGQTIMQLELDARRALMDEGIEEAARAAFGTLEDDDPDRARQLRDFVEANDLVNMNVAGAMNSNLAFYQGLASAGDFELDESEILAEVWASEEEIRIDTTEWVFGYLNLAYGPLENAALDGYIDFSRSDAGQQLNNALFVAFDDLFREISYAFGAAATRFGQGEDI